MANYVHLCYVNEAKTIRLVPLSTWSDRMRNHLHCTAAVAVFLTASLISPAFSQSPQKAPKELKQALSDLDSWIGKGANGDRWRAYLEIASLRSELAKGADADKAAVGRVLDRFGDP